MKTKLVLALATALGTTVALPQDDRRPAPPRPAEQPGRPDAPRDERPPGDERRPERRRVEGRPADDRAPGLRPQGDRAPQNPPAGDRRPENPRPSDGDRREPRNPGGERPAMKPTPFMGVLTAHIPPPMAAQLGLPEGFGLIVQEVVPGSPAATAGLQKYDILKLLDDQQLIDPNQLATLVRSRGKDADVALTIIRKGQEQKIAVKVGERMLEQRPFGSGLESPRDFDQTRGQVEEHVRRMQEQMQQRGREMQEHMRKFQERMKEWQKNPTGPAPEVPKFGGDSEPASPGPRDLLRESGPGGAPAVRHAQDGAVTTWNTARAHISAKDETGQIEVNSDNGTRTLMAKDAEGKTIFSGPIDTEEQRKALPEEVRRKLERLHAQSQTSRRGEASAEAAIRRESPQSPEQGIQ